MQPRRTFCTTLVLVLTTLAGVPAEAQVPVRKPGEKYALLVGVREYDPNELRSLPYSEPDVVELAQVLRDAGYRQVMLMIQMEETRRARLPPTAADIRTMLRGPLEGRDPNDSVIVAFSGHGIQFRESEGSYFCPMDTRLADRSTLISLDEVYQALEQSRAGVKLLLVDACRNDPQSDNSRAQSLVRLESITRPQVSSLRAAWRPCSVARRASGRSSTTGSSSACSIATSSRV